MRWQLIIIRILCVLWFPAAFAWLYPLRWTYENALTPFFPWGLGTLIAVGRSAAVVIPFAVLYFFMRLDFEFSNGGLTGYRIAAYVMAAIILLALFALLSLPAITSALVA